MKEETCQVAGDLTSTLHNTSGNPTLPPRWDGALVASGFMPDGNGTSPYPQGGIIEREK